MITVLADDITGAAEITGIGLRFPLRIAFDFDFNIKQIPAADVWVIASDTRSLPEKEACETVKKIAVFLRDNEIHSLFKKIDSALRGHIARETEILLEYLPQKQAFILPANPEMGRVIEKGIYFIHNRALNETSFAHDPDFPAQSASVETILNKTRSRRLLIPDCVRIEDLREYARRIDDETLPVGGSAFFEAYLQACYPSQEPEISSKKRPVSLGSPLLMVCGSTHETSKRFIRENQAFDVIEIPAHAVSTKHWTDKISERLQQHKRVLITVSGNDFSTSTAETVKSFSAEIVKQVLETCPVEELFIEGGATAYACLRSIGFPSLLPVEEYDRGVVRMKVAGREKLHITIKPGSYDWPENLFQS
jgi:uncharacterized protein YgbK (DUF1537 family)